MDSDLRNPKRHEWPPQSCVMDHRHSHYCQGELARPVPCSWQVRKQPPVTTPVMAIALKLRQPFPGERRKVLRDSCIGFHPSHRLRARQKIGAILSNLEWPRPAMSKIHL